MDEKKEEKDEQEDKKEPEDKAEPTPPEEAGAEETVVSDAKEIVDGMKEANKKKEELLEREEKLQAKKETLNALGGGSPAGEPGKPKLSETEKASREKIKAVGNATGAQWAKDMDKEDGN